MPTDARRPSLPSTVAGLLLAAAAGCSGGAPPEDPPRATPSVLVAAGAAGGYQVRLLATAALGVGLNDLALEVEGAASSRVTDATLAFTPVLTTSTSDPSLADIPHLTAGVNATHRCPVNGPGAAGSDGRYPLQAVFQVPSGPGAWTAEVAVARGGPAVKVPLALAVADVPTGNLTFDFVEGGTGYAVALEFLAPPRVGVVPVGLTLHETVDSGQTWAPVADATLGLLVDMPSMGHGGGTGGADPVLVTSGWYTGKASFTMNGVWRVTVPVTRGGVRIGATSSYPEGPEFWISL